MQWSKKRHSKFTDVTKQAQMETWCVCYSLLNTEPKPHQASGMSCGEISVNYLLWPRVWSWMVLVSAQLHSLWEETEEPDFARETDSVTGPVSTLAGLYWQCLEAVRCETVGNGFHISQQEMKLEKKLCCSSRRYNEVRSLTWEWRKDDRVRPHLS